MRFDRKATCYEGQALIQRKVASWCSQWLEPDLSGQSAIEFGAGPGTFTRHIVARSCKNLKATDLSSSMIQEGSKNFPAIEWSRADAWDPPAVSVSRIYSTSLLQWAPDPLEALIRWRKLLLPGGQILIALFVEGSLREFSQVYPDFTTLRWQSERQWLLATRRAGFKIKRWSTWQTKLFFPSSILALRSVHDTGACATNLASVASLRRALQRYDNLFGQSSGVPISWRALRIEAKIDSVIHPHPYLDEHPSIG